MIQNIIIENGKIMQDGRIPKWRIYIADQLGTVSVIPSSKVATKYVFKFEIDMDKKYVLSLINTNREAYCYIRLYDQFMIEDYFRQINHKVEIINCKNWSSEKRYSILKSKCIDTDFIKSLDDDPSIDMYVHLEMNKAFIINVNNYSYSKIYQRLMEMDPVEKIHKRLISTQTNKNYDVSIDLDEAELEEEE